MKKNLNILESKKRRGPSSKRPSIEEFIELREKMTIVKMAEHYEVTPATIVRWRKEFLEEVQKDGDKRRKA